MLAQDPVALAASLTTEDIPADDPAADMTEEEIDAEIERMSGEVDRWLASGIGEVA